MDDKIFNVYLKRIDEQYRHNAQFIFFKLITLNIFGQVKLKEILGDIYFEGFTDGEDKLRKLYDEERKLKIKGD